jgi:hypothetical protein
METGQSSEPLFRGIELTSRDPDRFLDGVLLGIEGMYWPY